MKVISRSGDSVEYDSGRIFKAIKQAFIACKHEISDEEIEEMMSEIPVWDGISVEEIQDEIEEILMDYDFKDVAKTYILYREHKSILRETNTTDKTVQELLEGINEYWNKENANKRANKTSTQRDYIAGITSTDVSRRLIFSPDVIEAHDKGIIHLHDMDYAIHNAITNCCLINLKDMLENGTVINDVLIEKQKRFTTACTVATQIIQNVASNQYGGCTISVAHLAPFLRMTKKYYQENYPEYWEVLLNDALRDGIQTFNYQVNSITASTGQSPFLTVHIDLEEDPEYKEEIREIAVEFLRQRIQGLKNKLGVYVTQTFPKIIVVLRDKYFDGFGTNGYNANPYSNFIYLCAECTAKRMVPDYMSEKNMLKYKGAVVPAMGCRSLLTPIYPDGKLKLYGRFNLGVCTLNLPYIAYLSKGSFSEFWKLLNKYATLCRKAQLTRVKRIANSYSDAAPTLWQYGAFARLPEHTKLSEIIYGGYASISLG